MPFVLDASTAVAFAAPDEFLSSHAEQLLRNDEAHVPAVWFFEVANSVLFHELRGRLSSVQARAMRATLGALAVTLDLSGANLALATLTDLARAYRLSTYDASYLELALRRGIPIATADGRLSSAAQRAGVTLIE